MLKIILSALAACLVMACTTPKQDHGAARAELAPSGKLRAGVNLGNTLFTTREKATGELRGVGIDLMRELGLRLGVEVEFVVHAKPGDVADAIDADTWDVAILAIEPARAQRMTFSPAITEIEATYLVVQDSTLRSVSQVDAPAIRIATPEKAGYELYLSRTLKNATLVRTKGLAAAIDLFKQRQVDALAGLRPDLVDLMNKMPASRLVDGSFMIVNHGLCVSRERGAAADYLKAFVEEIKATGFITRSIERHGINGVSTAK